MQQPSDKPSSSAPKRIGDLFVESGLLSAEQVQKGLDYGKKTNMPLGRVLVMLRLANDADLRAVLHVQQMMKFEGLPGNLAVRALAYMREKKVHIEWAVKQIGWESDKFKKDLPAPLREIKEKIADAETRLGADHPEVADLLLELVDFYVDEKMFAHAEATCEQALQKLEKAHGLNDLRVADAALKQSDVLFLQDQYDDSLRSAERALTIRQKMLGEDHPLVGAALRSLGEIHDMQRRFSEAERCYMQALIVIEKSHDIEDAEVLYLLRQLGHACKRAGRTPDVVLVGTLLTEAGMIEPTKVPEALAYSKEHGVPMARALVMMELLSESALRPALHAQLLIRSNLLPSAIAIRALRICHKKGIGLEESMQKVGWILQQGRRYELAQLLQTHDDLLQAESTLSKDHPDVGALCLRLADLFESYERYADAEPLYKRALAIMENNDGSDESMMEIMDRLAWVHVKQRKYEQAEAIYYRVMEMRIGMFGNDNADIGTSYANIGRLKIARGDHTDGVIWLQKGLHLLETHLSDDHPQVAEVVEQLAMSYFETGEHDLAEPQFWKAYNIKKQYLDVTSEEIVTLLTKLADMYNKDGKYTLADSVLVLFQQNTSVTI